MLGLAKSCLWSLNLQFVYYNVVRLNDIVTSVKQFSFLYCIAYYMLNVAIVIGL